MPTSTKIENARSCLGTGKEVCNLANMARKNEAYKVEKTAETVKIFTGNALVYAALKISKHAWIVRYNTLFFTE